MGQRRPAAADDKRLPSGSFPGGSLPGGDLPKSKGSSLCSQTGPDAKRDVTTQNTNASAQRPAVDLACKAVVVDTQSLHVHCDNTEHERERSRVKARSGSHGRRR